MILKSSAGDARHQVLALSGWRSLPGQHSQRIWWGMEATRISDRCSSCFTVKGKRTNSSREEVSSPSFSEQGDQKNHCFLSPFQCRTHCCNPFTEIFPPGVLTVPFSPRLRHRTYLCSPLPSLLTAVLSTFSFFYSSLCSVTTFFSITLLHTLSILPETPPSFPMYFLRYCLTCAHVHYALKDRFQSS